MIRLVVGKSVQQAKVVLAVAVALVVIGVWQVQQMSVDVLPEFTPPTVVVQTESLGLSAAEVEQLVTTPIEQDFLNGIAFLETIRSKTIPGLSEIELVFEPGTDIWKARQVVQERLSQTHVLPNVTKPPAMLQPLSSTSRVMMIGLSSKTLSLMDLSVLTRWTIQPRLTGVPGVANVAVFGQRDEQIQVHVDPERLKAAEVSLDEVIRSTGNALVVSPLSYLEGSTPGTGGFIDTPAQRLSIQHTQPILNPEQLGQISIERDVHAGPAAEPDQPSPEPPGPAQGPLKLADIATVVTDHQPLIGDGLLESGSGLVLVVERFPDANLLEVTDGLNAALDSLRPGLNGVEMDSTLFSPAGFVERSESNVAWLILAGAALLAALSLALFGWRGALVRVAAIVTSLVAATLVLRLLDTTMNGLILAGLVVALVVLIDDAVVDGARIAAHRPELADDGERQVGRAVLDAVVASRSTVAPAFVILLLVAVPALFLEGLSPNAFLRQLALSFVLAALASTVVAMTLTPALSALLLSGSSSPRTSRVEGPVRRAAALPAVALAIGALLLVLGVVAVPNLKHRLLPEYNDSNLLITWGGASGTSLPETNRVVTLASRELRTVPGVRKVSGHTGRAVTSDRVTNVDDADLWVTLDPAADHDRTVAAVRNVVLGYPGLRGEVTTYRDERVRQILGQTEKAISARVFGIDPAVMRQKAEEIRAVMADVDGVVVDDVEAQSSEPSVEVEVDLAAAQRAGIVPGDVRRAASTMAAGIHVGSIFEQQKVYEVVVKSTPEGRSSISSLEALLIDTPGGGHVPLGEVAKIRVKSSPALIRHEAASRSVDVTAAVNGRGLESAVSEVERRIATVKMPLEYHVELLSDYGEQREAERRVLGLVIGMAVVILLLLQVALASWRHAFAAAAGVALSLSGGVLALFAVGGTMTVAAFAGLAAVFVLAVRQAVVLSRRIQSLDGGAPVTAAEAAAERAGPVLATAALTIVALAPLVIAGDIVGLELLRPMAVVVLGGALTTTLVTLLVLPQLYTLVGRSSRTRPPSPITAEI